MAPIRPLKIMELQERSVEVHILRENLEIIGQNLKASGASHVSIVAVMGTYRTGKSFLLQFLTRFLNHRIAKEREAEAERKQLEAARKAAERAAQQGNASGEAANQQEGEQVPEQQQEPLPIVENHLAPEWRKGVEVERSLADWIKFGDAEKLFEGSFMDQENSGFAWRAGKDKHTSGIWIWDSPLVFTNADGRKVGLLLMDTQGAWDTKMSKAQNATLFGLTSLLSSKLVFNMQGTIDETKMENLDYIMTFAQTVCAELPGVGSPFGNLEILVRDWQHYDDGATLEECRAMMMEHLDDHMSPEKVPEDAVQRVERLRESVRSMRCFGLTEPGEKVKKKDFEGKLADIKPDFLYLLDDFAQTLFHGDVMPCAPLGMEITSGSFVQVVMNFAEAFKDNAAEMAIGLREAFVKVEMMQSKEQLLAEFKNQLAQRAPASAVIDPAELKTGVKELQEQVKHDFATKLKPWKLKASDEKERIEEFSRQVDEAANLRMLQNDQQVEGATVKLVASPVVGCAGYFLLLHPYAAIVAAAGGAYLHVRKWTVRTGAEVTDAEVTTGIYEDVVAWANQRWVDLQAMRVLVTRMTPDQAMQQITKASQQVTTMAASAVVQAKAGGSQETAQQQEK